MCSFVHNLLYQGTFRPCNRLDGVITSSLLLADKFVNGLVFQVCSVSINNC